MKRRRKRAFWLLVIVTGIVLRGIAIGHTPALTDEAFTFWRTCGSLGQLFETLRYDAFPPLHYVLVWGISKVLGSDVWVLRLPAAAAGVLMPLAVGRLARVLFGRRAATAATVLTLSSAYFAFFSRNAKMYMPGWLLMTLAIASILAYARTRRTRTLMWYVAFGAVGGMMMSLILLPLATAPLLALIWARHRRVSAAALAAVATLAVVAGPTLYYATFNRWFLDSGGFSHVSGGQPAEHDNGLGWIDDWQSGRSPANLTLETFTSFLTNYEWLPDESPIQWEYETVGGKVLLLTTVSLIWVAVLFLLAICYSLTGYASPDRGRRVLVLLVMVPLPLYAFYLRSFPTLASPWQLGRPVAAGACILFLLLLIRRSDRRSAGRRFLDATIQIAAAMAIFTVAWAAACWAYEHSPTLDGRVVWNPLWMPRYAAFIAPAVFAVIGGAVAKLPTRWARATMLYPFVGANLFMTFLPQCLATQFPWPQICRDLVATQQHDCRVVVGWSPFRSLGGLPGPYYSLVIEQGATVNPASFRVGNEWPYRPGPAVQETLKMVRLTTLNAPFATPDVETVIVWLSGNQRADIPSGWTAVAFEEQHVYSISNWREQALLTRHEYRRLKSASGPAAR